MACRSTFPNGCHVAEVEIDPETGSSLQIVTLCRVMISAPCQSFVVADHIEGWRRARHGPGVDGIIRRKYDAIVQMLTTDSFVADDRMAH